jgi:Helix-turn-helix
MDESGRVAALGSHLKRHCRGLGIFVGEPRSMKGGAGVALRRLRSVHRNDRTRYAVLPSQPRRTPRKQRGGSVQQLAEAARLSRRMLTGTELGQANPSLATVERVALVLEVDGECVPRALGLPDFAQPRRSYRGAAGVGFEPTNEHSPVAGFQHFL